MLVPELGTHPEPGARAEPTNAASVGLWKASSGDLNYNITSMIASVCLIEVLLVETRRPPRVSYWAHQVPPHQTLKYLKRCLWCAFW